MATDAERIEALEAHAARLEKGLLTLTAWLTQVPGCLGQHEYEPLRKIVQDAPEGATACGRCGHVHPRSDQSVLTCECGCLAEGATVGG